MESSGELKLVAQPRPTLGKKSKRYRAEGLMPAVVYGHEFPSMPILVDAKEFRRVYASAGSSHLIDLAIEGASRAEKTLVRDVQRDPLTREITHVDFYRVSMTEKLTTEVDITFVGESPLETSSTLMLIYGRSSVEIQCLPADLPERIVVDISRLTDVDHVVTAGDLALPPGVELLTDPDEIIVRVATVHAEEAPAEEAEAPGTEVPRVGRAESKKEQE